jgi:hypothetical protein
VLICFLPVVGWFILAFLLVQEGELPPPLPRAGD